MIFHLQVLQAKIQRTQKRSSNKRFTNSQKFQIINDMLLNVFLFVGVIWVLIQIIKDIKDF